MHYFKEKNSDLIILILNFSHNKTLNFVDILGFVTYYKNNLIINIIVYI